MGPGETGWCAVSMRTSQKATLRPLSRSPSPAQPPPSFVQRYLSTCGASRHFCTNHHAVPSRSWSFDMIMRQIAALC